MIPPPQKMGPRSVAGNSHGGGVIFEFLDRPMPLKKAYHFAAFRIFLSESMMFRCSDVQVQFISTAGRGQQVFFPFFSQPHERDHPWGRWFGDAMPGLCGNPQSPMGGVVDPPSPPSGGWWGPTPAFLYSPGSDPPIPHFRVAHFLVRIFVVGDERSFACKLP